MNDKLHNVLGGRSIIEAIRPSLVENSCLVDIELSFSATEDQKEQVITDMFMAGYHLRGDTLNTLTFLKEFDLP